MNESRVEAVETRGWKRKTDVDVVLSHHYFDTTPEGALSRYGVNGPRS